MVDKSTDEVFMVEEIMVEKFMLEKFMVENSGFEMSCATIQKYVAYVSVESPTTLFILTKHFRRIFFFDQGGHHVLL